MKKRNIRGRDPRLAQYKANRIAGMNRYNAAVDAGYSHSYASKAAKALEAQVAQDLKDVFAVKGLTDPKLAALVLEGINATKLQTCDIYIKDENGKLKINKNSNDFIEVPDWHARHKFIVTAAELTGRLKKIIEGAGVKGPDVKVINVIYPADYKPKSERSRIESTSQNIPG